MCLLCGLKRRGVDVGGVDGDEKTKKGVTRAAAAPTLGAVLKLPKDFSMRNCDVNMSRVLGRSCISRAILRTYKMTTLQHELQ